MSMAKRVGAIVALVGTAGLSLAGTAAIADSTAQFSGVQGQHGWHYGWYNLEDITVGNGVSVDTDQFHQFTFYDSGTGWWAADPFSAGGSPGSGAVPGSFAVVTAELMHPHAPFAQANVVAEEMWSVRRWTSTVAGTVTLEGLVAHFDYWGDPMTGNGTEAHILVDGQSVFSYDVAFQDFEGTAFGFDVSVSEGSVIEMVVGAKGDRAFDATRFDLRVTHVPAPGALALAGLGGLLTCRRRRA